MPRKFNLTSEIRGALRLLFRRSPHHAAALKASRVELIKYNKDGSKAKKPAVFYRCFQCKELYKVQHVEVHHAQKLGPAPGSKNAPADLTWKEFIERLFCDPEHLRTACKQCHAKLTREGK